MFIVDSVFSCGKYKGWSLFDTANEDPVYLRWVFDNREMLALRASDVLELEDLCEPDSTTSLVFVPSPPPPPPPLVIFTPKSPSIVWTDQQQLAIKHISRWAESEPDIRFVSLTGAAGSGKTTVLKALRERFGCRGTWAAMTGKAAARMKEAAGVRAKTLHSVLYRAPQEVDNIVERKIDLEFNDVRVGDNDEGDRSLLVVDEASMITSKIMQDITNSDFERILFVGDPYQLPPVDDDYSVFAFTQGAALTEVMRTAGPVLRAATSLRETDEIYVHSEVDEISRYDFDFQSSADDAFNRVLELWFKDPNDHVIITWKNKNRMHVNRTIREHLGFKEALPQPGEFIIICQNIHDQGLMNGDVVRVEEWLHHGPLFSGTDREGKAFSIESRWCRVRSDFVGGVKADGEKTICVALTGSEDGMFDGKLQYVGLENWHRAIEYAIKNADQSLFAINRSRRSINFTTPITYAYCLTAHKSQGSQYRRVTTYVPGDLRSKHFQAPTKLPNGDVMSYSTRWLYTSISRAVRHSTLVLSK